MFPTFLFLPVSIFENPETTESFQKLIFRVIKTIYLISSTFLSILCIQDTILKRKSLYNKQRNLCVSILPKNKRDYFGNLNSKIFTDYRKFWKTVSPLFSEKDLHRECITLKESTKTISKNVELAETFNTFFNQIVPNLNIDSNLGDNITNPNITDPVFCAIQKYEIHPSILKIEEMMGTNNLSFSFKFIDRKKIFNELQKLKSKKACQGSDIPVKIIKENIDIITDFIYNNFNNSLFSSYFPSNLKNADITPVF